MEPQKRLTVHAAGRLDADARAAYARAMQRADTDGGLRALAEVLAGAELFEIRDGEKVVLRYALRVDKHAEGAEGVIVAAVGKLPGVDLCELFLPVIERQLEGAAAVKVVTRRRGLVQKLRGAGYRVDGIILRKALA